ncbi:MAG: AAA family ATPase [bacterium]
MEKLSPVEFKQIIRDFHKFPDPPAVMIFGDPGIGKSFAAKEIAEELGREYMPLSLGRLEAYDIKGMPDLSGDFMRWKPPVLWSEIIKQKGNVLLHFDEFTLAEENVQGAVLDIVQMKKIDELKLPQNTMIVITGNMGGDDGTFAKALTSALTGGRAVIFEMKKPTVPEWVVYQKPCEMIKSFLEIYPAHLYRGFNAGTPFAPWSCPRSWSLLDYIVSKTGLEKEGADKKSLIRFARATISEDSANLLADFVEKTAMDAEEVLVGKKEAVKLFIKADNFRQSGIVKEIARINKKQDAQHEEKMQNFLNLILENKMPMELVALLAEELVKKNPVMLTKIVINGIPLNKWADKLAMDI